MAKNVLTITEARRNLPSLIKQVAEGRGPVYIGPRGEAVVALVSPADISGAATTGASTTGRRSGAGTVAEARSHLNGWEALRLELVGSWDDVLASKAERARQWQERLDAFPDRPRAPTKSRRKRPAKASPR